MPMADAYAHCEQLVREVDHDRFLASLFAPEERRRHLHALYAFNIEISRVRGNAHELLPGEMRLQWWRDALSGRGFGEIRASPVASALLETLVRFRLSATPLIELIEARRFDLRDEAMPTLAVFESYARRTSASLIEVGAAILNGGPVPAIAEPVRHAGTAHGIARLLQAFPLHYERGQLYLPLDVLARHNITRDTLAEANRADLHAAFKDLRHVAEAHLDAFARSGELPAAVGPAFLPAALTRPLLRRMNRIFYNPFTPFDLPKWRRQWTLWRASWGGILSI
jgi:15-cis-phytoene synthase